MSSYLNKIIDLKIIDLKTKLRKYELYKKRLSRVGSILVLSSPINLLVIIWFEIYSIPIKILMTQGLLFIVVVIAGIGANHAIEEIKKELNSYG